MGARLDGRSSGGGDDLVEAHEINVTPFIDVMLVLLIIFMVAAPLATVDIGVEPPASPAPPPPRPDKPVFMTVRSDLSLAVGENTVSRDALAGVLALATGGKKADALYLRADKSVSYGNLMEVMNLLRNAGYLKVALVGLDARN